MTVTKRILDLLLATFALLVLAVPMAVVAFLVKVTSKGPILYWSERVGRDNQIFSMPKFRTMRTDAPELPTHLLFDPSHWITPVGKFLRMTSLDELPQFWCVMRGDMSCVGPRPALYNHHDVIDLRTEKGVHELVPGLTGWAQINGRDELTTEVKVNCDEEYMLRKSLLFDLRILAITPLKVLRCEGIKQRDEVEKDDRDDFQQQPPQRKAA
jgi:O-antigen biosynthesis protein WbqP